jgi:hypothetical protein
MSYSDSGTYQGAEQPDPPAAEAVRPGGQTESRSKQGCGYPIPPPARHPHHPELPRRVSLSAVAGNEAGAQRANNAVTSVKEPSTQP